MVMESLILYAVLGLLFLAAALVSLVRANTWRKNHPLSIEPAVDDDDVEEAPPAPVHLKKAA